MKLRELLNNYKHGLFTNIKMMTKLNYLLIIGVLIVLNGQNCEEKLPSLQSDKSFVIYDSLDIYASDILGETKNIFPSLEKDDHLLMGKNDEVEAFSMMKFMDFTILPDTIDEVLELSFTFYTVNKLPIDTNLTNTNFIKISKILPSDGFDWNEEDLNSSNISIGDISKEDLVDDVFVGENDTCEFVLPENLIEFWKDSANASGGLIFEIPEDNGQFQSIYSSESAKKPFIKLQYIIGEDTTTKTIFPTDDVSVINYLTENNNSDRLYINEGREQCVLLNVDLENAITNADSNTYVVRGTLTFHIDKSQTRNYNDKIYLYLGLMDSTDWYDECLDNIINFESVCTLGTDDSVAVFTINGTIQNYLTESKDNVGIVLWSANATHDISNLSLYGANSPDQSKQPKIKLLFMKENE